MLKDANVTFLEDISKMDKLELLEYVKLISFSKLKNDEISCFLEYQHPLYAQIIFYLSQNNKILCYKNFRKTFIFENYDNFGKEEMYYLCEAMKNQIMLGYDDFYYIMHLFFRNLSKHSSLQRFLSS